ncbi:MAG: hypothetical protein JW836_03140 [Deltaproteobacteria bacterium]|nr:hypothetical protein [Deltaproteobacteria bacterium]
MFDDDSEEKRRKDLFKKVARAIKEDPKNYVEKLSEMGFTWVDDEMDEEAVEERAATIRNDNEKYLVAYFEGKTELSDEVLDAFLAEKSSDSPNYPLFRRYFKSGNENLKRLLLYGLNKHPTDIGLLGDLGYFNEFRNVLGDLIKAYLLACGKEHELGRFSELVMNFYMDSDLDGFDALYELEQMCIPGSAKWEVIQAVRKQIGSDAEPEDIEF